MTIPERSSTSCHSKLVRIDRRQAVLIPLEFELPGDRVWIRREGSKLIIEPVTGSQDIVELLARWKEEEPLGLEDQFPNILDMPATLEHLL